MKQKDKYSSLALIDLYIERQNKRLHLDVSGSSPMWTHTHPEGVEQQPQDATPQSGFQVSSSLFYVCDISWAAPASERGQNHDGWVEQSSGSRADLEVSRDIISPDRCRHGLRNRGRQQLIIGCYGCLFYSSNGNVSEFCNSKAC